MVARIDQTAPAAFLTLTQRDSLEVFNFDDAARAMNAFRKRLGRRYPKVALTWRKGLQARTDAGGIPAVHFHAIVWNAPGWTKDEAVAWWRELTGSAVDAEAVDLRPCRGVMAATRYAAKYVSKLERNPLDYVTYLAAESGLGGMWVSTETGEVLAEGEKVKGPGAGTGRWWGVWWRERLPWTLKMVATFALDDRTWWYRFKRAARHKWEGVRGPPWKGFTLFSTGPDAWLLLASALGGST